MSDVLVEEVATILAEEAESSVLREELEVIQVVWFQAIVRIAWKVVAGHGTQDDRSDDEDG